MSDYLEMFVLSAKLVALSSMLCFASLAVACFVNRKIVKPIWRMIVK